MKEDMEHGSTAPARPSARKPADQLFRIDFDIDHVFNRLANSCKKGLKGLRLREGPREPIQDEPLLTVGCLQTFIDDLDHDLVRNELPLIHETLHLFPKGSSF